MPFISQRFRFTQIVIQRIPLKCFLLVISISIVISIFLVPRVLENVARNPRYVEAYSKKEHLLKELKYILLWTPKDNLSFDKLEEGQRTFIKMKCSSINCYLTDDRTFFGGDLTKFDSIVFHGLDIEDFEKIHLPQQRSSHQKYIYFNMESSDIYPVCKDIFEDFFNWTSTYRLDSDIPYPYILIRDKNGAIVGPKRGMTWKVSEVEEDSFTHNKGKAAAWFVSNCANRSGRKEFVDRLQDYLRLYGLNVDVYGECGPLKCPKEAKKMCEYILGRDYFFYLSFENSLAEDYVTEKLLTALQHDVVPIVFGGADYSRFLPPNSYLDAVKMNVSDLVQRMTHSMLLPDLYSQFFHWKSHYTYHDPSTSNNICAVCAALNNATMMERKPAHEDFRSWWNPNFQERC